MGQLDARVRYTRMMIEKVFLQLLQKKPYSRITVTEICQQAEINRATFYKHYLDVPDLMESIEQDLFDRIRAAFDTESLDLKAFLLRMMCYTKEEKDRFFALGGDNGDPNLMTKTFMVCYERAYPLLEQNLREMEESHRQMLYQYLSHGSGAVLTWWIKDGMRQLPEEIVEFILSACTITADGIRTKI